MPRVDKKTTRKILKIAAEQLEELHPKQPLKEESAPFNFEEHSEEELSGSDYEPELVRYVSSYGCRMSMKMIMKL
jgi:hypothetical protein